MTLTSTEPITLGVGDGESVDFVFSFRIFSADGLAVYLLETDSTKPGYGVYVEQSSPTDYSIVSGIDSENGGTIRFVAAPSDTKAVLMHSRTVRSQDARYTGSGPFPAAVHEKALDKIVRITQEVAMRTERAIRIPLSDDPADINPELPPAALRKGKMFAFSSEDGAVFLMDVITPETVQQVYEVHDLLVAAQPAIEAARDAAEAAAVAAETARDEAIALGAALPEALPAESGRGLVVAPEGGWVLGGSAASKDVGTDNGNLMLKETVVPTLKSSEEQAIAGTDDTTIMTPARVKDAVEAHVPDVVVPEPLRTPVTVLTATTNLATAVRARGPADAAAGYPTGVLVGTSTSSQYIQRSVSAGASWVGISASPAISAAINDAIWIAPWGKFVAVGNNGQIYTADAAGATWTKKTAPTSANYQRVIYSPELNIAVIIANSGTGNRIVTSSDGETWTARTTPADEAWQLGAWGNGLFLVLSSADGSKAMTSTDGVVWVSRTVPSPPSAPLKVVYAEYLAKFVIVYTLAANSGNPYGKVKTTTDGIDYIEYDLPIGFIGANTAPSDIVVSEKNKRIIVPLAGNIRYIVSSDALTWRAVQCVSALPTGNAFVDDELGELLWYGGAEVRMLR